MKIWITYHDDRMFLNFRNFIRKLLGLKYIFLMRKMDGFTIRCWHDKSLGNPFKPKHSDDICELIKIPPEHAKRLSRNYIDN
jgi:hypothetical protein